MCVRVPVRVCVRACSVGGWMSVTSPNITCYFCTAGDANFNNVDIAALGGLLKLFLVC